MKYNIAALGAEDVSIAKTHRVGGEKRLYATAATAKTIGELVAISDGSGLWTPDPISTITSGGTDLAIMVYRQLKADADCTVKFGCQFDDDSSGFLVAKLTAPSWVDNKSSNFQHGIAKDLDTYSAYTDATTNTPVTKKVKAISGLISMTNAKRFSAFRVYELPQNTTDWQLIGFVETFDPKIGILPGIPVPDGLDGTAEVVSGRSEQSSLDITTLYRSVADGIMRFGGQQACFRCDILVKGVVLTERQIGINCIVSPEPTFPDGSEFAKQTIRGFMEKWLGFFAP